MNYAKLLAFSSVATIIIAAGAMATPGEDYFNFYGNLTEILATFNGNATFNHINANTANITTVNFVNETVTSINSSGNITAPWFNGMWNGSSAYAAKNATGWLNEFGYNGTYGQFQNVTATGTGTIGNLVVHSTAGLPVEVYAAWGTGSQYRAFVFENSGYFEVGDHYINANDYNLMDIANAISSVTEVVPSIWTYGMVIGDTGVTSLLNTQADGYDIISNFYAYPYASDGNKQVSDFLRIDTTQFGGERNFYIDANYNLGTIGTGTFAQLIAPMLNSTSISTNYINISGNLTQTSGNFKTSGNISFTNGWTIQNTTGNLTFWNSTKPAMCLDYATGTLWVEGCSRKV